MLPEAKFAKEAKVIPPRRDFLWLKTITLAKQGGTAYTHALAGFSKVERSARAFFVGKKLGY